MRKKETNNIRNNKSKTESQGKSEISRRKVSSYRNRKRTPVWIQILIVAITFIVVASVIFLGSRTYHEMRKMATEQFNQQQLILARSAATSIETYIKELSATLSSLAKLPDVQQMTPECLYCIQHTYWGLTSRTSIRFLDSNGILRLIYPFEGWRGKIIGKVFEQEAYFQDTKSTGHMSVSGWVINEIGDPRIRIAVPIYLTYETDTVRVGTETGIIVKPIDPSEPQFGRFQGVLVGSFDPYTIAQEFISPIISGKTGYAWVLNEDGIFIAHHEKEFFARNAFEVRKEKNPDISYEAVEEIQRKMMAGEEGVDRYISGWHRGQICEIEKLVAYTPVHIEGHIWSVAVCAPVSEVEEIIHISKRSEWYTLGFVILALILGGGFFFIISYRWSHSLELEVTKRTKELRETSDYLNNLIRYANAPIIVWNQDKRITIFNTALEKMSGWTETEMMEQPLDVLFPKESRSDSLQKIERTSKGEHWETVEIPILRKDGEIRIVLWNSANIYSDDGKTLIATIAQGQDITGRKKSQEKLQESEEKYRTLTDNINIGIYRNTPGSKGKFIEMNPAFIKMFGYRNKEELLSLNVSNLYKNPEDRKKFNKKVATDGFVRNEELQLKKKDGTFFIGSVSAVAVKDEKGKVKYYDGIIEEITERKQNEMKIKASLKEKEVLLQEIHHRVKNNLQVISSLLNMQARATKDKRTIDILSESRDRVNAISLIHSQLYESRDLSAINMKGFVNRLLVQLIQSYQVRDIKIERILNIVDYPFPISIAMPIGLIINELLTNALKYAFIKRNQGKIEVILSISEKGKFSLILSDDGVGLPQGFDINKIKTLGLHLVKILAEDQLQGKLEFISKEGTMVKIEFEIESDELKRI